MTGWPTKAPYLHMADNHRHTTDERIERDGAVGLIPDCPPPRMLLLPPVIIPAGWCGCCMRPVDEAGRCRCTD